MTVTEAICEVLKDFNAGLTPTDIYKEIIARNLYQFGEKIQYLLSMP